MKKKLKSLVMRISSLYYWGDAPECIFYHDIGKKYTQMGTPPSLFFSHMQVAKQLTLSKFPTVCFDDGFRGIWDEKDALLRLNIRPVVFIAPRLVGMPGYLNWAEIVRLKSDYGMIFQSHTWSHQTLVGPMMADSPQEERSESWFHRELVQSKNEIENKTGCNVNALCFPAGYYSNAIIERAADAGYMEVYTSHPGPTYIYPYKGIVVRSRCIVQDLSTSDFRAALRGGMNVFGRHYKSLQIFD